MYLLYHTFFEARNPRPHFLLQLTLTHTRPCASPSPGRAQPAGARGATVVSRQVARATVVSRRVARGVGKQAKCARSARRTTGGDRENECSSGAPAQARARSAGRATGATGRTKVRVARGRQQAKATRGNAHTRRVKRRRASRSAACAHPARPMGGSALNPRSAGAKRAHGAGAGVASSLQCRYYDQQPGKSAANTGQNTRSVVVVAP
jgi:hypothetical protein